MEVLKDLTLNISLCEINDFMMKFEDKWHYAYNLLSDTFDKDEVMNNSTTNRIIVLSIAIVSLNVFKGYVDEKILDAKRQELNDELEGLNTRKDHTTNEEYERVFNLLKQL